MSLGNLFRDQLDRYGELEHIAERWRGRGRGASSRRDARRQRRRPARRIARGQRERALRFGIDDPSCARPALQHASDSKYCVRCGAPYRYDAAYVGHLGAYHCDACGHARPSLDVAARDVQPDGLDGVSFALHTATASVRVRLSVPGLYNVYNALAAASLALALDVELDDVAAGLERFRAAFGRFERVAAGDRQLLLLLIKNPAGANEAIRTLEDGGVPQTLVVALNDEIADGRDVSWIWDVDFEPLLERAGTNRRERRARRGARAALHVRRFPT